MENILLMPVSKIAIQTIILKIACGVTLNSSESRKLATWRNEAKYHANLPELFADPFWIAKQLAQMDQYPVDRVWEKIQRKIQAPEGE